MTISGLIYALFFTIFAVIGIVLLSVIFHWKLPTTIIISILVTFLIFGGVTWYYNFTASGKRAVVDQQAELNNGLDRVINVYTANGDLIATYEGKIDLEDNEGGYVIFDFDGKRYTYYNCFVESIANIK